MQTKITINNHLMVNASAKSKGFGMGLFPRNFPVIHATLVGIST